MVGYIGILDYAMLQTVLTERFFFADDCGKIAPYGVVTSVGCIAVPFVAQCVSLLLILLLMLLTGLGKRFCPVLATWTFASGLRFNHCQAIPTSCRVLPLSRRTWQAIATLEKGIQGLLLCDRREPSCQDWSGHGVCLLQIQVHRMPSILRSWNSLAGERDIADCPKLY